MPPPCSGPRCGWPTTRSGPTSSGRAARSCPTTSYPHEPLEGVEESGLFTDVTEEVLPRDVLMPQREFVGYLSTVSAYLMLPLARRQQALARIADTLPAQVRLDVTVHLQLARRA